MPVKSFSVLAHLERQRHSKQRRRKILFKMETESQLSTLMYQQRQIMLIGIIMLILVFRFAHLYGLIFNKFLKDKSGVGIIVDYPRDHSVVNGMYSRVPNDRPPPLINF